MKPIDSAHKDKRNLMEIRGAFAELTSALRLP